MKTRIEIGIKVNGSNGLGLITKIITKSTGYVEVTYNYGIVKKEMAFNLTTEDGLILKSKPVKKEMTTEQTERSKKAHSAFMAHCNMAQLQDSFLNCQIESGNYNVNLM